VSALPVAQYAGCAVGVLALGSILSVGYPLLPVSALLAAVGSLLVAFAPGFGWPLIAAFFFLGISVSSTMAITGIVASRNAPGQAAKNLTSLFAFYCAGVVIGPPAVGFMLRSGLSYRTPFMLLGAVAIVSTVVTMLLRRPLPDLGHGLSFRSFSSAVREFPRLLLTAISLGFLYGAAECVPSIWIPKFLQSARDSSEAFSLAVLSLFWVAIGGGRLFCSWLIRRGATSRLVIAVFSAAGVAAFFLPALLGRTGLVASGFILLGICLSGIFPLTMAMVDWLPVRFTSMFLVVWAFNVGGASFMSAVVGRVADAVGFRAGMLMGAIPLALLFLVTVAFGSVLVVKKTPRAGG
jgi:fucose permease